jgi:hypothetical protein
VAYRPEVAITDIVLVNGASKIKRILQTDFVTKAFVVYPLPHLRQILGGDGLLKAGYAVAIDRDLYLGSF